MGGRGSGRNRHPEPPPIVVENANPWDRLPDEGDKAWHAFQLYRDLGPDRSIEATNTRRAGGKNNHTVLYKWSAEHHWRARVLAYDRHRDRARIAADIEADRIARIDMAKRHTKAAEGLFRFSTVELLRHLEEIGANVSNPDKRKRPTVENKNLAKLLETAIKLERLARGMPETVGETRNVASIADATRGALDDKEDDE